MTAQQFDVQKCRSSAKALSELLEQIISDEKMSVKQKKSRLAMVRHITKNISFCSFLLVLL
jgi:hypothetical protein